MHIQMNTGEDVRGDAALFARIEAEVRGALGHLADQLTSVELHIDDENAGGEGASDIRCSIEARPAGYRHLSVIHRAATAELAAGGAAKKMRQRLEGVLGKRADVKGGKSIRTSGSL